MFQENELNTMSTGSLQHNVNIKTLATFYDFDTFWGIIGRKTNVLSNTESTPHGFSSHKNIWCLYKRPIVEMKWPNRNSHRGDEMTLWFSTMGIPRLAVHNSIWWKPCTARQLASHFESRLFHSPIAQPLRQAGLCKGTVNSVWKTVWIPTGHVSP